MHIEQRAISCRAARVNQGMIVGGVGDSVGVKVWVGVSEGVGESDGVAVMRGVRVGLGVGVNVAVFVGVSVGASTRVGVASASAGYNSRMASYHDSPFVSAKVENRAPL
jgi:hypothetical protein